MKLLMLYGVNCTKEIWYQINPYFKEYDIEYVSYPHDVTLKAKKVDDLTSWVYDNYAHSYDAIIGHSLGGIIALQLVAKYSVKTDKLIYLDTNLKPANDFYRNLMLPENREKYGEFIQDMFNKEREFYTPELFESIQIDFDYTDLINDVAQDVFAIYGDRGVLEYPNRLKDLNLSNQVLNRLKFKFIKNSCHMIMIENPQELSTVIKDILDN